MIMKSIFDNIQMSFLRKALCLMTVAVAMPAVAQDEVTDDPAPRPVNKVVEKEKYTLVSVKGKVLDEISKKPLGGIQIKTLGNARYTAMTEDDGTFEIKVPEFATALYVHAPEFSSQQVAIPASRKDLVIYMLSDKFKPMYDDATSITANRSFTAKNAAAVSIDQEIQEQMGADVRSLQRSAQLAIGNNMFIRGINSINANAQPLVIVDGVEMDPQLYRNQLHQGQFNNMLANVMTADVEKVTVLKNATALYGARGANGVIIIETKRGHSMATRIEANLSVGLTLMPALPTTMNNTQYRNYVTEMMGTIPEIAGKNLNFKFLNDDPSFYYYHTYHNNTDWTDETYRTGLTQNYSINVQGGDDVGMYNLSVGYMDGKSTAEGNDFERMNVRFNTDINILKNLDTKFNLSIARTRASKFDDGAAEDMTAGTPTSPTFLSLIKSPLVAPYQYNHYLKDFSNLVSDYDDLFVSIDPNTSLANPTAILQNAEGDNKNFVENTYFQTMIEPRLKICKDLSISSLFSYTLNRHSQRYDRPSTGVPGYKIPDLGTAYNKVATMSSSENNILSNTHLDYSHIFGAHTVSAMVGFRYNYFSYSSDIISTQYKSRQDDKNPSVSYDQNAHYVDVGGANDVWKNMQWYANADYNYQNRYFLTLSLLAEANSRFGENSDGLDAFGVKWGIFPGVQAGWVLTNEKWFPKKTGINYLRLHAGYDISGNDDINNYAARTIFGVVKYNYKSNGLQMLTIGNDEVKWETTKKFNVGFETALLHNRVGVSFDYYIHNTDDLLTLQTFSNPIAGINNYWTNGGSLRNTGFEAAVSVKPVVSKDWNLEVGASVGHYKNEVTALPDGNYTSSVYGDDNILTSVGNPVALFYGYKTAGVFANDAEARQAAAAAGADDYLFIKDETGARSYFKAGDMHFVDLNNDGEINDADKVVIGDPNPDIYGNIFVNLSWKNLTLAANFNYSLGNDVYNYQRMILNSGSNFYNQQVAITNHWRYENQQTDIPRITYNDPMGNSRFSDRWIEDGSYLRLKTLRLTYKVPVNLSWLQGLSIWGEATNLFTLTKYLGSDPEFSIASSAMYQGIDCGNLAQGRAFTFGLKVNL